VTEPAASDDDVDRLLAHFDALGLVLLAGARGWTHMGAVLSDAALQRRTKYKQTVKPRILRLMDEWPDADTLSRFAVRIRTSDVGAVLRWREGPKLTLLRELVGALEGLEIETVADLRARLTAPNSEAVARLRDIRGVGPKTLDYIGILSGSEDNVAVDTHQRRFAAEAGVSATSYQALRDVVMAAARRRRWSPAAFEGTIWTYMSNGSPGTA